MGERMRFVYIAVLIVIFFAMPVFGADFVKLKIYPESVGVFTTVKTQQFVAFGINEDGSSVNITDKVSWKSSNTSIVIINETGLAQIQDGITNGKVTISCVYPKPNNIVSVLDLLIGKEKQQ